MNLATVRIEMSRLMPAHSAVVWELITDWEHQDDWMLEASDFVVIGDQREGVGVVAEATVKIAGIRTRDRVRVSKWEPERRLEISHQGWISGSGELVLTQMSDGDTRLDWVEVLHAPLGIIGAIGLRAVTPVMRRIFERDLRVLEGLCRARSRS